MSNGIIVTPSSVFLALLATVLLAGCEQAVPPALMREPAAAPRLDPFDFDRKRSDRARDRIWILDSDGLFLQERNTAKLMEVPLPSWQWVDTPYSCPPDLAVGPDGEAVVSSNIVPTLWRIDPETLAVTTHEVVLDADTDKDIGFSRLVYSVELGAYLAVNEAHGSLWQVDRSLGRGWKIARFTPVRDACSDALPRGAG